MIRIAVTGGRAHNIGVAELAAFDALWTRLGGTVMVNGGARGVDTMLRRYAERRGWQVEVYHPDWDRHGRAAGFIRNGEMVRHADALVAFRGGGGGTANCVEQARRRGLTVYVVAVDGTVAELVPRSPSSSG